MMIKKNNQGKKLNEKKDIEECSNLKKFQKKAAILVIDRIKPGTPLKKIKPI
jgi:hypothetical protein